MVNKGVTKADVSIMVQEHLKLMTFLKLPWSAWNQTWDNLLQRDMPNQMRTMTTWPLKQLVFTPIIGCSWHEKFWLHPKQLAGTHTLQLSIVAMRQKHYLLNDEPISFSLWRFFQLMLFLPTEHHGPWPSWMTKLVISEGWRKCEKAEIWMKYFQIFVIIWPSTKQSNTAVITSTSSV